MKIYTKTGDAGKTGLYSGERVPKTDVRISAVGCLDELNAALGLAVALGPDAAVVETIREVQNLIFRTAADLATSGEKSSLARISEPDILHIEALIDAADAKLPALHAFVLPGGTPPAAQLHVCRTICRRAEREAIAAESAHGISHRIPIILNRLSDLLFLLARLQNHVDGASVPEWVPKKP